ncbi:MAG: 4Fe-4S dicluster domain-containing protein [Acidobacteriota bacterium]
MSTMSTGSTSKIDHSLPPPSPRPTMKPIRIEGRPTKRRMAFHRYRKLIHLICFLIFIILPFFNVMRFDIPRQRFYFAGYELWINEFGILFFTLLFLLYVITAASMLYGRVYCGFMCPQMIFSEAANAIEDRLRRLINKRSGRYSAKQRQLATQALLYAVIGLASVFLAFVFISYFVEPRDLLRRLLALDMKTAGGVAGAATTLIIFLDFAFLRQRFCKLICPYGYLQGMLGDNNTLIVHYRDKTPEEGKDCIECQKCVRVCHMGIDIRKSPYQIECIHCGECIEACDDILGRFGKEGLIHYTWGEKGEVVADRKVPFLRRIGLRDAKRLVVILVLLFYASGLTVVLSMRDNVMVRIAPVRSSLYRLEGTGAATRVHNTFRMTVANRQNRGADLSLSLTGLPGASIELAQPIHLGANESVEAVFDISVAANTLPPGVNHFEIAGVATPGAETSSFKMTFITPTNPAKQ